MGEKDGKEGTRKESRGKTGTQSDRQTYSLIKTVMFYYEFSMWVRGTEMPDMSPQLFSFSRMSFFFLIFST